MKTLCGGLPLTRWTVLFVGATLLALPAKASEVPLIEKGATWRFLDDGSDQGMVWVEEAFDDSGWKSGPAELGFGDGDEVTLVDSGPDPMSRPIVTYFRHSFEVTDPATLLKLQVSLLRDDGAVVYLNGVELFRNNLPKGSIDYLTTALVTIGGLDESRFFSREFDATGLVAGTNLLAVSVHQKAADSSDLSLDLSLVGLDGSPGLVRGPYLQMGTESEVTVRWRTSGETDGEVLFGLSPEKLDQTAESLSVGLDHAVTVEGLAPQTRYYYSVGTTSESLAGADNEHFFVTSAPSGSDRPFRVWVLGDSGRANNKARAVRDAYAGLSPSRLTDFWLMLGDNAYNDGTDAEYQEAVFAFYPALLRSSVLWPSLGNHDNETSDSMSETGPYFDMFTLPRQGEAGGVPSGSEAYFSFDYGNVHFINLDSAGSGLLVEGPMLVWLEDDLAANQAPWTVAFFHHPPYSKGSHDSDTETRLINMRENAVVLLEDYGVDLVLAGHSHSYERSFLLDGHYGSSQDFLESMKLDPGDGQVAGDGPYEKPERFPEPHQGAVYVVAGSSSETSGGELNHPAMHVSLNRLGSVVLDVHGDALKLRFLSADGEVVDQFTMVKGEASPLLELEVSPSVTGPGTPVTVKATGAQPGELLSIGFSLQGPGVGPCPGPFGGLCLDLLQPVLLPNEVVANEDGVATLELVVPAVGVTGRFPFQAVATRGVEGQDSVKSNLAFVTVAEP